MKVRAQIGMVLNLDKCIGCHTCSVTCKNVWTTREGMEYAWFNNVETKPGIGYPKDWENQEKWAGGWVRKSNGKIEPRIGSKWQVLMKIFANPHLPQIDDYYEPWTYDYETLLNDQVLQALHELGITWLICDESHRVKSHKAATSKRLITLAANIEMRFIMTGTPITNTEADIWSQAMILDQGRTFGTSFSKFYNQFFTKGQYGWYQGDFISAREERFKQLVASFSLRKRKDECLDLPKVMPEIIREVELTGEALKYYKEMRDEALIILKDEKITAQHKIVELGACIRSAAAVSETSASTVTSSMS